MKLVVTGAAGFVGSEVGRVAAERGHEVLGIDRRQSDDALPFSIETADITDRDRMIDVIGDSHAVIHCAALVGPAPATADPAAATEINVLGALAMLEAARRHSCRIVNLSTATLYGRRADAAPLSEAEPADPVGIYDATKFMSETLCDSYRKSFGVDVASFRTGFVYGRNHSTGDYFVGRMLAGVTRIREPGRDHPCDFTYVKDLALGLVQAAEARALPEPVYNVTGGVARTRGELAGIVSQYFPEADIELEPGVDPARHLRGPCILDRARRDFGYAPAFDLEAGMADWIAAERQADPQ